MVKMSKNMIGILLLMTTTAATGTLSQSAQTSCSENVAMKTCIFPIISYAMSNDIPFESQPNIVRFCKISREFLTCITTYTDRCVNQNFADAHQIIRGTKRLLTFCDQPADAYSKVVVLRTCTQQLNATTPIDTFLRCGKRALQHMPEYAADSSNALLHMRSGTLLENTAGEPEWNKNEDKFKFNFNFNLNINLRPTSLRDLCCAGKEMKKCLAPEFNKCSTPAHNLVRNGWDAFFEVYNCQQKITNGCPITVSP